MAIDNKFMLTSVFGPADPGGKRLKMMYGTFDFDSSYPTGGEAMDLSNEFTELLYVNMTPMLGYFFEYDKTNKKILAYESGADGGANDEVGNTTDLATVGLLNVPFFAFGY
jgi:hypothetical protein